VAGNVRFKIDRTTYGVAEYARLWQLAGDGIYRPIDIATLSVGMSYDL
jgi:hypothetical protein